MKRRDFSNTVLGLGLGASSLAAARAGPGRPGRGQGLRPPEPAAARAAGQDRGDRVLLVRLPALQCLRAALEAWAKKLPADVAFRRVPVAFRDEPFVAHQKIFYALEAMGQVEAMHRKVFYAIHNDRARLDKAADITAFMVKNGLDGAKFTQLFESFSVQTKATPGTQAGRGLPHRRRAGAGRAWPLLHLGHAGRVGRALADGDRLPDPDRPQTGLRAVAGADQHRLCARGLRGLGGPTDGLAAQACCTATSRAGAQELWLE